MKRIISLCIILTIISCNQNSRQNLIIEINNKTKENDTLIIYDYYWDTIAKININANSKKTDTLINFEKDYYFVRTKNAASTALLKANSRPVIEIFKNQIKYLGDLGNVNNYLTAKSKFERTLKSTSPTSSYHKKLSEREFIKLLNLNHNKRIEFLEKYNKVNKLDKTFIELEKKSINYHKMYRLGYYESNMKFLKNDTTFTVSQEFPKIFEKVIFDEKLSIDFNYLHFLRSFIKKELNKEYVAEKERPLKKVKLVDQLIEDPITKSYIVYEICRYEIAHSNKQKELYELGKKLIKKKRYIDKVTEIYLETKKLKNGDLAPDFTFFTKDKKTLKLKDLKGKFIYIDIWNTYCKPCIIDLVPFEKLKNEYSTKNIEFISVCTNSKKNNWEKLIAEKKLSSPQVFLKNKNDSFLKKYNITSNPRYILINDKGKIINLYAKKPSNKKLRNQFEKVLK